jgi:hypothetical protein
LGVDHGPFHRGCRADGVTIVGVETKGEHGGFGVCGESADYNNGEHKLEHGEGTQAWC